MASQNARTTTNKERHRTNCGLAMNLATKVAENFMSYSRIYDLTKDEAIACFDKEEIEVGELLGKGGFNEVHAVDGIKFHGQSRRYANKKTLSKLQKETRKKMDHQEPKSSRYAIKFLKGEIIEEPKDYMNGAADLILETKILSSIKSHPNIITLHGTAAAGISGFSEGIKLGSYFLILDRLTETLQDRFDIWKKSKPSLFARTKVGFDLASALAHLHAQKVIFRDLKPDNVGFDDQGTLKIFDFGLAKELDPRQEVAEDLYEMSGITGSRRYMAPEVALSKPYGFGADIYSFGVLFWETCALLEPYEGMSVKQHTELVIIGLARPEIKSEWPEQLRNVMKWSWMPDQDIRPPMVEIRRALKSSLRSHKPKDGLPEQWIMVYPNSLQLRNLKKFPRTCL